MVKRSMRRKNAIGFLRENVSKGFTEVRNEDVLWLVSLSKLGGDGDLVDLFFQSSCLKVIFMKRPVIFGRGYGS